MKKLLVICGPTAVGKTALALHLGKVFNGELLSADSRQVYRGMDIVTGKDLPKDGTKIWLVDLVEPTDDFSVSRWRKAAMGVMGELGERKKLPIVVGGTGFYIKALLDGIETINVPRNVKLRSTLSSKTPDELFAILAHLDSVRASRMNQSDRQNPRRLVRAIEIARWQRENGGVGRLGGIDRDASADEVLFIGLKAPWDVLRQRIEKRVEKLMQEGALEEVKRLVDSSVLWTAQSMTGIGYHKFRDYFTGKVTLDEVKEKWVQADLQYAKRQMTWFKRDNLIRWFDITKPGWQKNVEKQVLAWYNTSNAHD